MLSQVKAWVGFSLPTAVNILSFKAETWVFAVKKARKILEITTDALDQHCYGDCRKHSETQLDIYGFFYTHADLSCE